MSIWGFPFKLIVRYNSKIYGIRTEEEAKEFQMKLRRNQEEDTKVAVALPGKVTRGFKRI